MKFRGMFLGVAETELTNGPKRRRIGSSRALWRVERYFCCALDSLLIE